MQEKQGNQKGGDAMNGNDDTGEDEFSDADGVSVATVPALMNKIAFYGEKSAHKRLFCV